MIKEIKYLIAIAPAYRKTIEAAVVGLICLKKLSPSLLALMLSAKIW